MIREDGDGDYVTILEKDEDYRHNVAVYFILSPDGEKLQMVGLSDFRPAVSLDSAIEFCNGWNVSKSFGQAFFTPQLGFQINVALNNPGEAGVDYLKSSFFRFHLAVFWQFFKEVGARFDQI